MDDIKSIYKYNQALATIRKAYNVLILVHERPDGDALASMCALSVLLDKLNIGYTLFSADPPSPAFSFLPNWEKITTERERVENKNFFQFDLIILVDCACMSRSKLEKEIKHRKSYQFVIELDHHPCREKQASDLEIRFPQAAATTELIYYFLKHNQIKITKDLAECILTGILTDTVNFFHPSATKETIDIASKMLAKGAQFPKISKKIWQNKNVNAMRLWSVVLGNLRINPKYNIAFTVLTEKEMEKFQEDEEVLESITNFLNNLKDVKAVVFLRQEKKGLIKGNLRTNHPRVNVAKLANHLGGGGHIKAAGFSLKGEIKKTTNGWKVV